MRQRLIAPLVLALLAGPHLVLAADDIVVRPVRATVPLFNYEGAPATPDADDPAVWNNRHDRQRSLLIGTAKDAGLLIYDLGGQLLQALLPPNAPKVLPRNSPTRSTRDTAQQVRALVTRHA